MARKVYQLFEGDDMVSVSGTFAFASAWANGAPGRSVDVVEVPTHDQCTDPADCLPPTIVAPRPVVNPTTSHTGGPHDFGG